MDENNLQNQNRSKILSFFILSSKKKLVFFIGLILLILSGIYYFGLSPTRNFPVGDVLTIKSGDSLQTITSYLKSKNIIRSEFIFRSLVIIFGGEKKVIAGDYLLKEPEDSITLVKRFIIDGYGMDTVRITIPEGWNIFQISDYLDKTLLNFNEADFLARAKNMEGYLFPDTYFVPKNATPSYIIEMMNKNYAEKVAKIESEKTINKSLREIIIMASILEGEALPRDRGVVAGILWNRIKLGMPLQVDSTFKYINGKNTYELTLDDLQIDSRYNTYKYPGLPVGPISNPGLNSIIASAKPEKTNYMYFLTERDGTIHYAKTFEEHKLNRQKYLNK